MTTRSMPRTRCGRAKRISRHGPQSEAFRAAHKNAGDNKPVYLDAPEFEGFTAVDGVSVAR
ncbi:hypothetical protein PB2503_00020 [Parvularcula bermudensis HTCC2503]|uniref:Uncharacterized protein n=1 Tax=Parvularcula bermudensis (strain ATCC BAA-594 / HTCC2503 / KCTC 12087) TaxID=314260 RepID=E0THI3_PARBH|nr:hypothetical protein PB2503_00020 [Parvularcula bermudensis HTCC2503]